MSELAARATVPAIGRSIETQEVYVEHLRAKRAIGDLSCDLCAAVSRQERLDLYPEIDGKPFVLTNEYFALVVNDYPYFAYDGQEVKAHHMLLPREHIGSRALLLDRFWRNAQADARSEIEELTNGFYHADLRRSSSSPASSIRAHDHTHLFRFGRPVVAQHFSIEQRKNDIAFSQVAPTNRR